MCNPVQAMGLLFEFAIRSKNMKLEAEIFIVPRNLPFAVLGALLLLHTRFRGDIYSKTNVNSASLLCTK